MEKVTYIIGAGFSAPLGLPVMSNFLAQSKDMYFADTDKYSHFEQVLSSIAELSVIKNYFSTDLFNIEEILSIVEMEAFLKGEKMNTDYYRYIVDVINEFTPTPNSAGVSRPGNWYDFMFGPDDSLSKYCYFIASLLRRKRSI